MLSHGPTAVLPIRRPSEQEYETCDHLDLTDPEGWEPYDQDSENKFPTYSSVNQVASNDLASSNIANEEVIPYCFTSKITSTPILNAEALINSITLKEQREATPERLAKLWGCGLETAKRTLEATTHKAYREYLSSTGSLTRKFRTRLAQLKYRQLALPHGAIYSDTMFSKIKSLRGFTCGQLYCND